MTELIAELRAEIDNLKQELAEAKAINAEFDKAVEEVARFKANDGSVEELARLRVEVNSLRQVLNAVLQQCKEPSCQDIHAEPWIPDELGNLIRQKLRSSKT